MISNSQKLTSLVVVVVIAPCLSMCLAEVPTATAAESRSNPEKAKCEASAAKRIASLEKQLAEARKLAQREHRQAEKISADVLRQVDAQGAIARELKETIALVQREREKLIAKIAAQPKVDPKVHERLIAENEKLSKSLREAWESAKSAEKVSRDHGEMQATLRDREMQLKEALDSQQKLKDQLGVADAAREKAQKQATTHRAEALRERIFRKKLETQLEDLEEASRQAVAAEKKASEEAALLEIAPVYFGKNKADSDAQEQSLVEQVAAIHQRFPEARFSVSGHTCTDGRPAINLALSQRRAQRIADLLIGSGIPAESLVEVVGRGDKDPIGDNATQAGREANRRVEIKVLRE